MCVSCSCPTETRRKDGTIAAGHINAEAGFGAWPAGERLLVQLRHEVLAVSAPALCSPALSSIAA
ncbi:MAG: hypothetical protein GEV05_13855 [Betaproteobacteria bacterium]|nr:hypothetical protein [Betaproteobacteria bacterium]